MVVIRSNASLGISLLWLNQHINPEYDEQHQTKGGAIKKMELADIMMEVVKLLLNWWWQSKG